MKLNLGCGGKAPQGWVNVDYALGAKLVKFPFFSAINRKIKFFNMDWDKGIFIYDLRQNFPWQDNSIDVIYSSHTLEHLTRKEGLHFLKECHRVLKKKGLIRIVVPDLSLLVSKYINGNIRANEFIEKLGVLYNTSHDQPIKRKLAPLIECPHKCMYDTQSLLLIMTEVGFDMVTKKPFESDIPDIADIELPNRAKNALIIEGRI